MDRVLKICMPFLLATLCTISGFVTAIPLPPVNSSADTVTDLVTVINFNSSLGSVIATSGTTQTQYDTVEQSEASTSLPNTSGDAFNQTVNNGSQTAINPPASLPATTATTTTSQLTTVAPATSTSLVTVPTTPGFTTQSHTVSIVHSTTTKAATIVPTVPTTLHITPKVLTSPKSPTTTQAPLVKTSATQAHVPVHKTSPVATTHTTSSSQGTFSTSSKSTHIPDNQTTKESGDWSIIGISGNSFTGKILLPIAVGTAFSVIIIAVAYCYCSRRGSKYTQAKSSRNGVHRMTSNDRVMLLADSSEDEF